MKTFYHTELFFSRPAVVDLIKVDTPDDAYLITRINVPQSWRRKGVGTRLLKKVLKDADAERVTLMLSPAPSDPAFHEEDLIKWYEKHGFTQFPAGYMVRAPR